MFDMRKQYSELKDIHMHYGGGQYETMDACNCAVQKDIAFANELEMQAQ